MGMVIFYQAFKHWRPDNQGTTGV
uniref:Uncharacterized protein n=1 Tax=Rhizophora mucronata TaxID=61149 RepID=A0A2P2P820_RHIMU